jgi:tight adherence protein B
MAVAAALIAFLLIAGVGATLARRKFESSAAAERLQQVTRKASGVDQALLRPIPRPRVAGEYPRPAQFDILQRLEQMLWQAGIYKSVSAIILMTVALFALGTGGGMVVAGDPLIALGAGLGLAVIPVVYIRIRRQRRLNAFLAQYPYALDLIKSSLEVGHTLQRGLQVVQDEFVDPLGGEFRAVVEQTRLGMPLNEALADMLKRVPLEDLRLLVVAVKVQSEVGSSLAQIIGRLGEIVRTRQRLYLQIRALTAQSRMSGMVVGLLPVVVLAMFSLIQPRNTEMLFFDPAGKMLLRIALGLDLGAFLIIRRILNVRY